MASLDPVADDKNNSYRVPLFKKGEFFVIWTGSGSVRYFDVGTLPDVIKVRLGIIMNSPYAAELNKKEMTDLDMSKGMLQTDLYASKFSEEYNDIGWQYNKYYYCIILSKEELADLRTRGAKEASFVTKKEKKDKKE